MRRLSNPDQREFTRFVKETEPRLSYALAAAYGMETGVEATADALEWAALDQLSRNQRVAVAMIHGLGYSKREVADLDLALHQPSDDATAGTVPYGVGTGPPASTGWGLLSIAVFLAVFALVFILLAVPSARTRPRLRGRE